MCKKGVERKRRRMVEAELRDITERFFEGLWETAGDGVNFQVPGAGDDGGR